MIIFNLLGPFFSFFCIFFYLFFVFILNILILSQKVCLCVDA